MKSIPEANGESRALDILLDCVEKVHLETEYRSSDTACGVGRKLTAARRLLKSNRTKRGKDNV